jgi:acyl-CoA thioesterase-1
MRNRAPLFLAQVDPDKLHVVRRTERVLIPERGVPLGNFGAATIDANESWVSDAEFILGDKPNPRGGDGSVFASRVLWSRPNRLVYGQSVAARPLRIIALGDSITKGVRQGVAANETFAAMIEAKLRQSGVSAEVVNLGVGSERTDLALARLDRDVIARKPDMVMIMYGTNDSYVDRGATDTRITQEQYRTNLKKIIEQLQAAGIKPVLMTEPRWGDAAAANGLGEHPNVRLERYMAACREVARETRVPLVDHFAVWSEHAKQGKDVGQWTTDQCHPNVAGHRFMAETILPVLRDHWLTNHPQPR